MQSIINAKTLRAELAAILERVRQGESITIVYRSRVMCRLVPVEGAEPPLGPPEDDPLYQAEAVGRSRDGLSSSEHDGLLYGAGRG